MVRRVASVSVARLRQRLRQDGGTVIPLVALSIVVLLGMAAFAVDLGLLYGERRQAQTAADASALAGALAMSGGESAAVTDAMELARRNLDQTYDDPTWAALWAGCSDAGRPASFVPSATSDCISFDHGASLIRVRIPNQSVDAIFGGLLGVDTYRTNATAVARFLPALVRPFAAVAGQPSGEYCLQNPPGGHAKLPCTGPTSGNFGSMHNPRHTLACPGNKNNALVWNIALGIDHGIAVWSVGDPLVIDECPNVKPNQVVTDTGNFPNEATAGFATGGPPLVAGELPLLQQGTNAKKDVIIDGITYPLDDRPLWDYLIPNSTPGCADTDFAGLDGVAATAQMDICVTAWTAGELFDTSIVESPRFVIIPQMLEATLPSGSGPMTIERFRAVFVNALGFGDAVFYPGDAGATFIADTASIEQTTSFMLPLTPLVAGWVTPGSDGVLATATVQLYG